MGDITILIIFVLSICYLAYKVLNNPRNENEAERQALLASIKELKKRGRPKKSWLPEVYGMISLEMVGHWDSKPGSQSYPVYGNATEYPNTY